MKNSPKKFLLSHIQNQLLVCRGLFLAEESKQGGNNLTQITPGTYKASKVSQALFCGNVEAAEKTNGKTEKGIICK